MARLIATRCLVLLIATIHCWVCATQNIDDFSVPLKTKPNFSLETVFDKDATLLNFNFTANGQNLEPPRNVTDFFKGQWSQLVESSTWRISTDDKETVNPFGRHSGVLVFQLNTKPSPLTYVDIVQGDLLIRDGMWSTDGNKRYNLQGLYFWDTGDLFMVANPLSKPVIQDFDVSLTNESTIRDVLAKAEGMIANVETSQDKDKEEDKPEGDQCFWKILFKAKPVFAFENDVLKQPNGNRAPTKPTLDVKGIMHSPNCKVALVSEATTILFDTYYRKATNYVLMVTIISCIQIWLTIRQMESTTTQTSAAKVSLLTIGMQAIMDSYLSLLHLTAGIIVESVFNPYATASFVKFILFSIFEMRYLLFIFKARNPQTFAAGWNVIRRKLSQFYMRFYGVIFLGFVLIYYFNGLFIVLLFSLYSLWIPQIICNATQDTDHALSKKYVIGMTLTRLCIPLYFYGCPKNFVHAEPDFTLVSYLVAYLITQVGVLLMQDVLGPRWFIPKRFLPEKYNYRRSYEPDPETGLDRECVICMNTVRASDRDYMITPCNHVFHDECLRQWMALKMECPTCRGPLPYP